MTQYQKFLFTLEVDDGWPPVAAEGLVFSEKEPGYRLEVAPLFVKDLSVGDVLEIQSAADSSVVRWRPLSKSRRSTVWIMDLGDRNVLRVVGELKRIGCNVEDFAQYHYYAIDVPEDAPVQRVTDCLDQLNEELAPVAYPSWRHEDDAEDG